MRRHPYRAGSKRIAIGAIWLGMVSGVTPNRRLRVIVIDDLPDAVMMLLTLLRSEGYEVQGFGSAREALKHLQDFDPDVVISDIAMPQVSGWDLAREVRRVMGKFRPMLIA